MEDGSATRLSVYTRHRMVWLVVCLLAFVNAAAMVVFLGQSPSIPWPVLMIASVVMVLLYTAIKRSRKRFRDVCDRSGDGPTAPCPFCGYDLTTAGDVVRCSECGARVRTANLSTYWLQVRRRPYWRSDRELLRRLVGV